MHLDPPPSFFFACFQKIFKRGYVHQKRSRETKKGQWRDNIIQLCQMQWAERQNPVSFIPTLLFVVQLPIYDAQGGVVDWQIPAPVGKCFV